MAATFALTPLVVTNMGKEGYGAVVTITSLAGLAAVTDLGLGGGLVARLSQACGRSDLSEARALVSTAFVALLSVGTALAGLAVAAAFLCPWSRILGLSTTALNDSRLAVLVFGVSLGLGLPLGVGDRVLISIQRGSRAAGWALASSVSSLLAMALTSHESHSIVAVVAASCVTPRIIAGIETIETLKRVCPELRPSVVTASTGAWRRLRSAGILFLVQGVAIAVAFESDMLVVSGTIGAGAASIYSLNMRVISLIGSFALVAFGQLFPAFGDAMGAHDQTWIRMMLRRLTIGILAYSASVSVILYFIEPRFVAWWVGVEFVPDRSLLLAFLLWSAYSTALIPANMLLNAALAVRMQVIVALSMASLNLPLSIFLASHWGISGPAWGSLIAHVSVSLLPTIVCCRRIVRGVVSVKSLPSEPSLREFA